MCPKPRCNTLVKYSKFWRLQRWYSRLHTCSGGREPELAVFLFTYSYAESPRSIGPYHTPLERPFQEDYDAVEIVRIGSVFKENPTPSVARRLEKNSQRTSDITGR